jgi:hypothetical protein
VANGPTKPIKKSDFVSRALIRQLTGYLGPKTRRYIESIDISECDETHEWTIRCPYEKVGRLRGLINRVAPSGLWILQPLLVFAANHVPTECDGIVEAKSKGSTKTKWKDAIG